MARTPKGRKPKAPPAIEPVDNVGSTELEGPVFAQTAPTPDPIQFEVKHPSDNPVYKKIDALNREHKITTLPFPAPRDLPEPRLTLAAVLNIKDAELEEKITKQGQLVFHSTGDTGNTRGSRCRPCRSHLRSARSSSAVQSTWAIEANQRNEKVEMLSPPPIVIMATLAPIPVSASVPQFDIARECTLEGGSTVIFHRCSRDETTALSQLRAKWARFGSADQKTCMGEATIGGFASYVELLACLEMARDVATPNNSPDDPRTKPESGPRLAGRPGFTIDEAP